MWMIVITVITAGIHTDYPDANHLFRTRTECNSALIRRIPEIKVKDSWFMECRYFQFPSEEPHRHI